MKDNESINVENEEGYHEKRHKKKSIASHHRGPETFRRRRVVAFLEMMFLKRSTIKQQLNQPEFESIQQVLIGELKAIDTVINEFTQLFDLHQSEAVDKVNLKKKEAEAFNNN